MFSHLDYVLAFLPLAAALGYLANRLYFSGGICRIKKRLDSKIVIITGANTGIGFETALDLASRGARVILACRNEKLANKSADQIKFQTKNENIAVELVDLGDLHSIRNFAERIKAKYNHIDILLNNAGVMHCPSMKTKDGFEMQFGVNHLGHFLLTNLLLNLIKNSDDGRILNVSSCLHYFGSIKWYDLMSEKKYNPSSAYWQSKLANVLFTTELARRLDGTNVRVASLHPGVVRTELFRHEPEGLGQFVPYVKFMVYPIWWVMTKNPKEGAQTSIHCCLDDKLVNGAYYSDCKIKRPSLLGTSFELSERLWDISSKLVNL